MLYILYINAGYTEQESPLLVTFSLTQNELKQLRWGEVKEEVYNSRFIMYYLYIQLKCLIQFNSIQFKKWFVPKGQLKGTQEIEVRGRVKYK